MKYKFIRKVSANSNLCYKCPFKCFDRHLIYFVIYALHFYLSLLVEIQKKNLGREYIANSFYNFILKYITRRENDSILSINYNKIVSF